MKVPVFVIPQISDEDWNVITALSAEEQLQLRGNLGIVTDGSQAEHQITMDEFIAMLEGDEENGM